MNIKRYYCSSCANKGTAQNGSPACILYQKIIDPTKDFCSQHTPINNTVKCDVCNLSIYPASQFNIWLINDKDYYVCPNCNKYIGTCNSCAYTSECDFRNDHSEPQIINQTVQQGFMTVQTQVKNPKLVEKHCISCRCSIDNKGTCLKNDNAAVCPNWVIKQ